MILVTILKDRFSPLEHTLFNSFLLRNKDRVVIAAKKTLGVKADIEISPDSPHSSLYEAMYKADLWVNDNRKIITHAITLNLDCFKFIVLMHNQDNIEKFVTDSTYSQIYLVGSEYNAQPDYVSFASIFFTTKVIAQYANSGFAKSKSILDPISLSIYYISSRNRYTWAKL